MHSSGGLSAFQSPKRPSTGIPAEPALTLRFEDNSLKLVAGTVPPVELRLPLGTTFKATILSIEELEGFIYVRPTSVKPVFNEFVTAKAKAVQEEIFERVDTVSYDEIYFVNCNNGFRGALTRTLSPSKFTMYDIDSGCSKTVSITHIFKLPSSLSHYPPLAFRALIPVGALLELLPLPIVFIEIGHDFLSGPVKSLQEGYPPSIVCELFVDGQGTKLPSKSDNEKSISEVGGEEVVDDVPRAVARSPRSKRVSFPRFETTFPCRLNAKVTMQIARGVYLMRNTTVLAALYNEMIRPTVNLSLVGFNGSVADVPCIVHVKRPLNRNVARVGRCRFYRGLLRSYDVESGACEVFLVDYDEVTTCDMTVVFDLTRQPSSVLSTPAAAFLLQVDSITPPRGNGHSNVKLEDDEEYSVWLTSKNKEGVFVGSVTVPLGSEEKYGRDARRRRTITRAEGGSTRTGNGEEDTQVLAEHLKDVRKKLDDERKVFEKLREDRLEEIATMALQLQMVNINRATEHIVETATRNNLVFGGSGVGGVGVSGLTAAAMNGVVGWNARSVAMRSPSGAHHSPSSPFSFETAYFN